MVVVLLAAPLCRGHHSEQTLMKDLAIIFSWMLFLTHPGLEPAASGSQDLTADLLQPPRDCVDNDSV